MGDRALVQFKDNSGNVSPVICLHWMGSNVGFLLKSTKKIMQTTDLEYCAARFVGVCHVFHKGDTGIGIWNHPGILVEKDSPGDAGCFIVNCETWEVETFGGYGLLGEKV